MIRKAYKLSTIRREYDIPYSTVWAAVKNGQLKGFRINGRWYVLHPDLMAWIEPPHPTPTLS